MSTAVTTTADAGIGSLRQAIIDAELDAAADVIDITAVGTVTLLSDLPPITNPLTINGPGSASFVVDGAGFDVFVATSSSSLDISGLAITQAGTLSSTSAIDGTTTGVVLDDVVVSNSFAGVGINNGTVQVTASTFILNDNDGLAISSFSAGSTIDGSTFESNGAHGVSANLSGPAGLTITDSVSTLNAESGFFAELHSTSVLSISNATATNNGVLAGVDGFVLEVGDDSTATVSNSAATGNGDDGYDFTVDAVAELTVTSSSSTNNDGDGFNITVGDGAELEMTGTGATLNGTSGFDLEFSASSTETFTDTSANENDGIGIEIEIIEGAEATFTSTTVTDNDQAGIEIFAEDSAEITFTESTVTDNDNTGIAVEAIDGAEVTFTDAAVSGHDIDGLDVEAFDGVTIVLDGVDSSNNDTNGFDIDADGGGVTVTVTDATASTAEVGFDILVLHGADLTMSDSVVSNNTERGILIDNEAANSSGSVITIERTTVQLNGDGSRNGGGIGIVQTHDLTVLIQDSTVAGNEGRQGGGIYARMAGAGPTNLTIQNSTVSGNSGEIGGGAYLRSNSGAAVSLLNSTFTDNVTTTAVPSTAAVYLQGTTSEIRNTIVADNAVMDLDLSAGTSATIDYSLVQVPGGAAATVISAGTANIVGFDARLGPLADNGGPTDTHLPQTDSPVIEAGDPAFSGPTEDQRGSARVVGVLDIGAVESRAVLAASGVDPTPTLAAGLLVVSAGLALVLAVRRRTRVASN